MDLRHPRAPRRVSARHARVRAPRSILWLAVLLCGCHGDVAVSPPEQQRTQFDATALGPFVRMNQTNAERYFVSGVYQLEDNAWRWCGGKAVVRLRLGTVEGLKFLMKHAVPIQVIERAKTVRMRILINGKLWEQMVYEKDGIYDIEKPAPMKFLQPNAENVITIEVDRPLPAQGDRPEMGFILVHVGFQPG